MRSKVYLGLVHYPVYNKGGETVATSVTILTYMIYLEPAKLMM